MYSKSKKGYSGPERRHFIRIPFSFHVYFTPCGLDKDNPTPGGFPDYCYSHNISEEGIQIKCHHKPQTGEFLKIQITLQESQGFHVMGRIIWSQYDKTKEISTAGVQFVDLKDSDKDKLKNFIKKSLKYGE